MCSIKIHRGNEYEFLDVKPILHEIGFERNYKFGPAANCLAIKAHWQIISGVSLLGV